MATYDLDEVFRGRVLRVLLELRNPLLDGHDGDAPAELLTQAAQDDVPARRKGVHDVHQCGKVFLCEHPVDVRLTNGVERDPVDGLRGTRQLEMNAIRVTVYARH